MKLLQVYLKKLSFLMYQANMFVYNTVSSWETVKYQFDNCT